MAEMALGAATQIGQRRAQWRRCPPRHDFLAIGPVPVEEFDRHEKLAARGVERKRLEQAGNGVGTGGMMAEGVETGPSSPLRIWAASAMRLADAPSA